MTTIQMSQIIRTSIDALTSYQDVPRCVFCRSAICSICLQKKQACDDLRAVAGNLEKIAFAENPSLKPKKKGKRRNARHAK